MSDRPTPETDAMVVERRSARDWLEHLQRTEEFARRLERQRDAAVEASEQIAAWKREELEWHNRHDKDRIRLGECESQRDAALQRAEKTEAELAAFKVERESPQPNGAVLRCTKCNAETTIAFQYATGDSNEH